MEVETVIIPWKGLFPIKKTNIIKEPYWYGPNTKQKKWCAKNTK